MSYTYSLAKRHRVFKFAVVFRPLQDSFQQQAKEMLEAQAEGEVGVRRKRHASLQEQLQGLWVRAKLFEKGVELFDGTTTLLHPINLLVSFSCHSFHLSFGRWVRPVACLMALCWLFCR